MPTYSADPAHPRVDSSPHVRETREEIFARAAEIMSRRSSPSVRAADDAIRPLRSHDHDDWRRYDLARLRAELRAIIAQIDPLTEAIGDVSRRPANLFDDGGPLVRAYTARAQILVSAEKAVHLLGILEVRS